MTEIDFSIESILSDGRGAAVYEAWDKRESKESQLFLWKFVQRLVEGHLMDEEQVWLTVARSAKYSMGGCGMTFEVWSDFLKMIESNHG